MEEYVLVVIYTLSIISGHIINFVSHYIFLDFSYYHESPHYLVFIRFLLYIYIILNSIYGICAWFLFTYLNILFFLELRDFILTTRIEPISETEVLIVENEWFAENLLSDEHRRINEKAIFLDDLKRKNAPEYLKRKKYLKELKLRIIRSEVRDEMAIRYKNVTLSHQEKENIENQLYNEAVLKYKADLAQKREFFLKFTSSRISSIDDYDKEEILNQIEYEKKKKKERKPLKGIPFKDFKEKVEPIAALFKYSYLLHVPFKDPFGVLLKEIRFLNEFLIVFMYTFYYLFKHRRLPMTFYYDVNLLSEDKEIIIENFVLPITRVRLATVALAKFTIAINEALLLLLAFFVSATITMSFYTMLIYISVPVYDLPPLFYETRVFFPFDAITGDF